MLNLNCRVGDIITLSDEFTLEVLETTRKVVTVRIQSDRNIGLTIKIPNPEVPDSLSVDRRMVA